MGLAFNWMFVSGPDEATMKEVLRRPVNVCKISTFLNLHPAKDSRAEQRASNRRLSPATKLQPVAKCVFNPFNQMAK